MDLVTASARGSMGMAAGDFVEVFRHPDFAGAFDAVATCFFIDTAHNVVEYMEVIWAALKVSCTGSAGAADTCPQW